jgi:hypothetical protein
LQGTLPELPNLTPDLPLVMPMPTHSRESSNATH